MPFIKKQYSEIVNDLLEQVTHGIAKERHIFSSSRRRYDLECRVENKPVKDIVSVLGFSNGNLLTFEKEKDYKLVDNALEWIADSGGNTHPSDKSDFIVTYIFDDPSGLTDINVGSVLRTIVEAMSREIELLYAQMELVYNAGFIDTATAGSLDLVVSILGIKRKPPTFANGYVTFLKDSDPPDITLSEVILFDNGRETYELKTTPVKNIISVTSAIREDQSPFHEGIDYELDNNSIRWIIGGSTPQDRTEFTVEYLAYQNIEIPAGTLISTYSKQSENSRLFETRTSAVLGRTAYGKWEANVEAFALEPGIIGNVAAGSINVMPKPPVGVDKVINRSAMFGGADSETDESLRERAKKVLDVKGKATLESLRTALTGIEGVGSDPVLIDMPDNIPGIVKAIVDGGDTEQIEKVIENTRAAGIRVEFSRPKIVLLDLDVVASVMKTGPAGTAAQQSIPSRVEKAIRNFVSSLKIGEDVIVNQLVAVLLDEVPEIHDVIDLTIRSYRKAEGLEYDLAAEPGTELTVVKEEQQSIGEATRTTTSTITASTKSSASTTESASKPTDKIENSMGHDADSITGATTVAATTETETNRSMQENVHITGEERAYARNIDVKVRVKK